jgi:hypothetical protein
MRTNLQPNVSNASCRVLISGEGYVYDCDRNYVLGCLFSNYCTQGSPPPHDSSSDPSSIVPDLIDASLNFLELRSSVEFIFIGEFPSPVPPDIEAGMIPLLLSSIVHARPTGSL